MKELYELGIVFRGFILVSHKFRPLPIQKDENPDKDLRGAFISAISSFAETAFSNVSLEYLESSDILFIFKMAEIKSRDSPQNEPIIMYGLVDKKRKPDKQVRKFLEKIEPILQLFKHKYSDTDFTDLNQFQDFKKEIKEFFD